MNVNLRFVNLLKSTLIIGTIVITLLISSVSNVFAGGPRLDYPEDGDAPQEALSINFFSIFLPSCTSSLVVVLAYIGDNLAYRHGLHFCCKEVYPYRNQK